MVSAKTFHHTAHMRKPFLLLWINWKGKNCHLQMLNFFCYLMWENFCHLKFCHNRINPLDSCSEAWTLVCSRWPTVYLPISIPHNFSPIFFQHPYLFLRLLLFTISARLSSLFVHFPFSSDPNMYTDTCRTDPIICTDSIICTGPFIRTVLNSGGSYCSFSLPQWKTLGKVS